LSIHNRKPNYRNSLRLPDFDYSQNGAYFITIVTQNRECLFGCIDVGEMILNDAGKMVDSVCEEIPKFISGIWIPSYQIMPNHFHAVVVIQKGSPVGADLRVCPGQPQRVAPTEGNISLPDVVQRFKSLTTRRYIEGVRLLGWRRFERHLWQRNYYEKVIRNEREFQAVVDYIENNPQNWEKDKEYYTTNSLQGEWMICGPI
jgi:REP element-mobilizing transposase RayT